MVALGMEVPISLPKSSNSSKTACLDTHRPEGCRMKGSKGRNPTLFPPGRQQMGWAPGETAFRSNRCRRRLCPASFAQGGANRSCLMPLVWSAGAIPAPWNVWHRGKMDVGLYMLLPGLFILSVLILLGQGKCWSLGFSLSLAVCRSSVQSWVNTGPPTSSGVEKRMEQGEKPSPVK